MTHFFLTPAMAHSRHNHATTPRNGYSTRPPNYVVIQRLSKWSRWDSNPGPSDYESGALTS